MNIEHVSTTNRHVDLILSDGDGGEVHLTLHGTPVDLALTDRGIWFGVWDDGADAARDYVEVSYADLVALAEGRVKLVAV